tara:strand:+ start:3081 stop:4007 length:927 start_codon:yes stop_codon:yes gene_type:complete
MNTKLNKRNRKKTKKNIKYGGKITIDNILNNNNNNNNNNNIKIKREPTAENKKQFNKLVNKEKKKVENQINKAPAQMSLEQYKSLNKPLEPKKVMNIRDPLVFEYMFSPLLSEKQMIDAKQSQGSFFVGVNLTKLFDEIRKLILGKGADPKNSDEIYRKIGEWVDYDYDKAQIEKVGIRNETEMPLKPENKLSRYSSLKNILQESKKYSGVSMLGKITPLGLIKMTKILHKFQKNEEQWLHIATTLQLLYKYLNNNESREDFFKSNNEIPLHIIYELEEFYNTEHLFMTIDELKEFKKKLDFYKSRTI